MSKSTSSSTATSPACTASPASLPTISLVTFGYVYRAPSLLQGRDLAAAASHAGVAWHWCASEGVGYFEVATEEDPSIVAAAERKDLDRAPPWPEGARAVPLDHPAMKQAMWALAPWLRARWLMVYDPQVRITMIELGYVDDVDLPFTAFDRSKYRSGDELMVDKKLFHDFMMKAHVHWDAGWRMLAYKWALDRLEALENQKYIQWQVMCPVEELAPWPPP